MASESNGQWRVTVNLWGAEDTWYLKGEGTYQEIVDWCQSASATVVRARHLSEAAIRRDLGIVEGTEVFDMLFGEQTDK